MVVPKPETERQREGVRDAQFGASGSLVAQFKAKKNDEKQPNLARMRRV
jgi:hypothetical protein